MITRVIREKTSDTGPSLQDALEKKELSQLLLVPKGVLGHSSLHKDLSKFKIDVPACKLK